MRRFVLLPAIVLLLAGSLWLDSRAQTNAPVTSGAHRFQKVAEGI